MYTKKKNIEEVKIDLSIFKSKITYELKYLREYLSFTNELVEMKDRHLSDTMAEDAELDPENEAIIQRIFENEKDALLSYYHHSSIVLLYTVLESALSELCSEVQRATSAKFSFTDLSSKNLIGKSLDYLKITSNFKFETIEGEWARIGQYQQLRNMIVHQNAIFTGNETKIERQKNRIRNNFATIKTSNEHNRFYILNDELVIEFLEKIRITIYNIANIIEQTTYIIEKQPEIINMSDMPF